MINAKKNVCPITTGDLKSVAYLPGEIADLKKNLADLDRLPISSISPAKRKDYAVAVDELKSTYKEQLHQCTVQMERIQAFFDSIHDDLIYDLFRLRYQKNIGLVKIGILINSKYGVCYDAESLRMICNRYIERYNANVTKTKNGKTSTL